MMAKEEKVSMIQINKSIKQPQEEGQVFKIIIDQPTKQQEAGEKKSILTRCWNFFTSDCVKEIFCYIFRKIGLLIGIFLFLLFWVFLSYIVYLFSKFIGWW